VVWATSEGNYVRLYLASGQCLLHRCTLAALEQELGSEQFLRVHRGALINHSYAVEVRTPRSGPTIVVLRDGAEVEVSQRLAATVLDRLGVRSHRHQERQSQP
jgi:DNA-binding LytR/AlgR family response regulator